MAATPKAKRQLRDAGQGKTPKQPVSITAAPAGGSGATAGAYDSAANRDIAIASLNKVIQILKDLGFAV